MSSDLDARLEAMCQQAVDLWEAGQAAEAEALWRDAAEQGSGRAMYNLGVVALESGDGAHAEAWFERGASVTPPYPDAVHALSILAMDVDHARAALLAEQAAELGVVAAAFNRGQIALWSEDFPTAKRWWRQAADLGDEQAAYNLAIQLQNEGDEDAARVMFWRSAELGHPDGMNNVAVFLRLDDEDDEALDWYTRAAEAGSTLAMRNLAEIADEDGRSEEAAVWLQQAADLGDPVAVSRLQSRTRVTRTSGVKVGIAWGAADVVHPAYANRYCTECGSVIDVTDRFCPACGTKVNADT